MQNKRVVITGANSGLGYQTAKKIAQTGAEVIMVCRSQDRGQQAQAALRKETKNEAIHLELCDFSSLTSIEECGQLFRKKYEQVDVLINNAGAIFGKHQLTDDGLERTFALNHMGYFYFTHFLLDLVRAGQDKRIVSVASYAHNFPKRVPWDDLQLKDQPYSQLKTYGLSKLYNIYFTRQLAQLLEEEGQGVTVNCLHPGTLSTGFGKTGTGIFYGLFRFIGPFIDSPEKGARTSFMLATDPKLEDVTGQYFAHMRKGKLSKLARNKDNPPRLWEHSKSIVGIDTYGEV